MVKHPDRMIRPANECSICDRPFHEGDRAICIVRVPVGDVDTICESDWAILLASSTLGLRGVGVLDQSAFSKLLLDAIDALDDAKDSEVVPTA